MLKTLLLAMALFSALSPSSAYQLSHAHTNHTRAGQNGYSLQRLQLSYQSARGIGSHEDATIGKKESYWPLRPEWMIVWVTAIYTAVSAIALVFIGLQVKVSRDSSKRQLRAYLGVIIGDAMWQEREKGYRFGGLPHLINSGQTPAYKVTIITKVDVLPFPLPREYRLSEVGDDEGETVIGINQPFTLHGKMVEFVRDEEVELIKSGEGDKCLYIWGILRYVDAFGDPHFTRFCHRMKWLPGGKVYGYYEPGRNHAN